MNWSAFARRPGVALDRVFAGDTFILERHDSVWKLRLRPVKPGEAETAALPASNVWWVSDIRRHPDAPWVAVRRQPLFVSRRGKIEAVLEVAP